jgi:hypothetical protein
MSNNPNLPDSIYHRYLDAIMPARETLYGYALQRGITAVQAEAYLSAALRSRLDDFAQGQAPAETADFITWLVQAMPQGPVATTSQPQPAAIPMDMWARLCGAIQIEAARKGAGHYLNPESVLLNPDPLLAPRTKRATVDFTPSDTPSSSRLILGLTVVVLLGIIASIYLITAGSKAPPATQPSQESASQPSTQPA